MFTLNGRVENIYPAPKGINKKTGEEYGGQDKVQILGSLPIPDSDSYRLDIITLTTDNAPEFQKLIGREVSVPVGIISRGKNDTLFFIPKGSKVSPVPINKAS
jgi:hypothetical protein